MGVFSSKIALPVAHNLIASALGAGLMFAYVGMGKALEPCQTATVATVERVEQMLLTGSIEAADEASRDLTVTAPKCGCAWEIRAQVLAIRYTKVGKRKKESKNREIRRDCFEAASMANRLDPANHRVKAIQEFCGANS